MLLTLVKAIIVDGETGWMKPAPWICCMYLWLKNKKNYDIEAKQTVGVETFQILKEDQTRLFNACPAKSKYGWNTGTQWVCATLLLVQSSFW